MVKDIIECPWCGDIFKKGPFLDMHVTRHCNITRAGWYGFKCFCGLKFAKLYEILPHLKEHGGCLEHLLDNPKCWKIHERAISKLVRP